MLLRTRIALMVSLSSLILALALFAEGRLREHWADQRYRDTLIAGDINAWAGVRDGALDRLEAYGREIIDDERIPRAIADGDHATLALALTEMQVKMHAAREPALLALVGTRGEVYFASDAKRQRISKEQADEVLRRGALVRGLLRNPDNSLSLAVLLPTYSRSGPSGVLGIFVDGAQLIDETALATAAGVFIADRQGEGIAASRDLQKLALPLAAFFAAAQKTGAASGVNSEKVGGKVFTVSWSALQDAFEQPLGRLVSVRDVSASSRQAALVSTLSFGALISGGLLFLAFLYWYMRHAFRPLNDIIRLLNALARGDTTVAIADRGQRDEIGRLAGTVEKFRQAQQARNALGRLSQDLNAASRLQRSILPRDFPVNDDYRLAALMRPASDVGGDFYDFFDLPDGRLGCIMADVSGKGMAAALFMAMARTVIRSVARLSEDAGDCLARANDLLCASNVDDGTFVTVFYGILDPQSGTFAYTNGGHNPPYRIRSDGSVEALPGTQGIALGVMDGLEYTTASLDLAAGDTLFFYTDGVTEAVSPEEELFGEWRLEESLAGGAGVEVAKLLEKVVAAVDAFAATAPQADDITCLAIAYRQPSGGAWLR